MNRIYSLNKLQVTNFRNLKNQVIEFGPKITCIFGDNGNGKSNILEAIYYLFNKKSFKKNTSYPQLLSFDCEQPDILIQSVVLDNEERPHSYSLKLNTQTCDYYLDSKATKKRLNVPTVFINPFDAQGFFQTAKERRTWFDQHFCYYDENFKHCLSKYKHYLKFKNTLLVERPAQFKEQIEAAHYSIAPIIFEMIKIKKNIIEELNKELETIFGKIFAENMKLELFFSPSLMAPSAEELLSRLNNLLQDELKIKKTMYGPHRDDYVLLMNGLSATDYASLGQQKSSYLSLLFAYIELFRYKFKASPIVLMDDVSGELDSLRWSHLTKFLKLGGYQVVLTTANENFKDEVEKLEGVKKLKVDNGTIIA